MNPKFSYNSGWHTDWSILQGIPTTGILIPFFNKYSLNIKASVKVWVAPTNIRPSNYKASIVFLVAIN